MTKLIFSSEELAKEKDHDVLIIGSGPAATAIAERLMTRSNLRIAMVERGSAILALTHFNNLCENSDRREFLNRFGRRPWEGQLAAGTMLFTLGGRSIVAGANLPRFYETDFSLYPYGRWPQRVRDALPALYTEAERIRRVSSGDLPGPAQQWAKERLRAFSPEPPRIGVEKCAEGFRPPMGYDSSVERLWSHIVMDSLKSGPRRLRVATGCYAAQILHDGTRATGVRCFDASRPNHPPVEIGARAIVLAASPIESARIAITSGLAQERPAVGRYFAEHIEGRARIRVSTESDPGIGHGISLVLPPSSDRPADRFQFHLRGEIDPSDERKFIVTIAGFGAMDPSFENRVTLAQRSDRFGFARAYTTLSPTAGDTERLRAMCARIGDVVGRLGGKYIREEFPTESRSSKDVDGIGEIRIMDAGLSHHEGGTLRMGSDPETSATTEFGVMVGMSNLFAADAALFPCVGVANPMLTVAALAYWVADHVSEALSIL